MFPEELWWDQVPGAMRLRSTLQEVLLQEGKTAWLESGFPWDTDFRNRISDDICGKDSRFLFTVYSGEELSGRSPEDLVFQLNPDAKVRYMPGQSLSKYVQTNGLLKTHIVWLYNLKADEHTSWFEFSRQLAGAKAGLRVICQGDIGKKRSQNVSMLYQQDFFSEFDRILFAMLLASNKEAPVDLRTYYSYLAAGLAEEQVELIPLLLQSPHQLTTDPAGTAEALGLDTQKINKIVHAVQLKVLLPKLEDRQEALVDDLSQSLLELLPFEDNFGNKYDDLYSIELRNMYHYRNSGELRMTQEQSHQLQRLYDARNLIAHRKVVPGVDVIKLLN